MVILSSHGFKFSRPDANFVFDVSYFKNPWREKEIREEKMVSVRRKKILEYMQKQEGAIELIDRIASVIRLVYLLHPDESIKVALCCSAGEYRSPAMVELLGAMLSKEGMKIKIIHSAEVKI